MKEFIKKLIGRLEESRKTALNKVKLPIMIVCKHDLQEFVDICFEESKNIVNQLAEEYNNGWIPCSERLPEENGYYLITIKYYHLHNNVTMGCFFDDGEWWKIDKDDKVIAWQPLPEPFKPKGE